MPVLKPNALLCALAICVIVALPAAANAGISFSLRDNYIDVPFDYKQQARDYMVNELGYAPAALGNIQLLAIRRSQFEDIITRVQAIVRFKQQPGSVVVVMRRSGSVITHFNQE